MTTFIYPLKDMLHLASTRLRRVLSVSRERCGCMKKPSCEKTLSTAADVAGVKKCVPVATAISQSLPLYVRLPLN